MAKQITDDRIADAVAQQHDLIAMHVHRAEAKRDRYRTDTIDWTFAQLEYLHWREIEEMLKALLEGKTIQPS